MRAETEKALEALNRTVKRLEAEAPPKPLAEKLSPFSGKPVENYESYPLKDRELSAADIYKLLPPGASPKQSSLPVFGPGTGNTTPQPDPYKVLEDPADKLRDSLSEVIEANLEAVASQERVQKAQEAAQKRAEEAHKRVLDSFDAMGLSGTELITEFQKMRQGAEELDKKFAELSAWAASPEARAMLGKQGQKDLQDQVLRTKAAEPGPGGELARAQLKERQEADAAERRKKDFGIFQGLGGVAGSLTGGQGALGGAGGIAGAFGGMAGMAGGLATPTGAALKFGEALFGSIDKVNKWADSLHQANMQFAEFSGAMARVQMQSEVHRIELDRQKGNARAGTAGALEQSKYEKDKAWAPVENAWANTKNVVGTAFNKVWGAVGQAVTKFMGMKEDKSKELGILQGIDTPLARRAQEWAEQQAKERERDRHRKRRRR